MSALDVLRVLGNCVWLLYKSYVDLGKLPFSFGLKIPVLFKPALEKLNAIGRELKSIVTDLTRGNGTSAWE